MELKTTVKDLGRMPWFYRANSRTGKIFGKKSLHLDEETEMVIDYMHYPKGFTTVLHRHPASHGIYVLEGQLETDGELYGPGTFVWYPEGIAATHGATEYEDLKCLLISNKAFSIEYLEEEEQRQNSLEKKVMDVNRMPWFYRRGLPRSITDTRRVMDFLFWRVSYRPEMSFMGREPLSGIRKGM